MSSIKGNFFFKEKWVKKEKKNTLFLLQIIEESKFVSNYMDYYQFQFITKVLSLHIVILEIINKV